MQWAGSNNKSNMTQTVAVLAILSVGIMASGCGSGSHGNTNRSKTTTLPVPANFTTIDGPGGGGTTINGISNNGAVVGFTANNGTNANFVRAAAGGFTPLNIGDPAAGMVNGVNSAGKIVGVANNQAFLLAGGTQTTLAPPNATEAIAFGINEAGVIVGQYTANGKTPGFVDVNGTFTTIQPTPAAMVVNVQSVNNQGQAIGFYSEDGTHQHGFLYNISSGKTTLLPDPSTPHTAADGLVLTQFLSINDNGEAVGYYQTNNGSQFGFLYNLATNAYTYLDAPQAAPVNGVQITQITGVTNTGDVSGFFIDANGDQHGFIASPSSH